MPSKFIDIHSFACSVSDVQSLYSVCTGHVPIAASIKIWLLLSLLLPGIHACVSNGRLSEAEALFEPLRAAGGPSGPHIVAAYNLLLKGHSAVGATEATRRLFVLMKSRGVMPDLVTYNTLMTAFVAAGQNVMARAVLDKARREGMSPDVWSYTILLRGLTKEGDMGAAGALLDEMIAAGVKPNQVRGAKSKVAYLHMHP